VDNEILDHACRLLSGEATRTLSGRMLYRRTTVALGIDITYRRFLDVLSARPDRFIVAADRTRVGDRWNARELRHYAAMLEDARLARGEVVMLADVPGEQDRRPAATLEPLGAMLADVHAALTDLLRVEDPVLLAGPLADAVTELDELRDVLDTARNRKP
jgi:hypothetical protein